MSIVSWSLVGFLLGSIPFSPLIGRWALGKDIRAVGDHNPGATNVLRSGNIVWFIVALMLDISKGAIAVGLASQIFSIASWHIVPIALSASLGHAFSPFLGWQGGKAIATTFGVWIGLTIWTIPLISLLSLVVLALVLRPHGWAVMGTMVLIIGATWFWLGDGMLTAVALLQTPLLAYTHRHDLQQQPTVKK